MTKADFEQLFFGAFCRYYEAEEGSPAEYTARGEIKALKAITRSIYGRDEAHEIRHRAAKNADYVIYGSDDE